MVWYVGSKQEAKGIDLLDKELARASDRAVAVIAGSILETRLTAFLKSKVRDAKTWDKRTNPSGALGSFAIKIDVAYLFHLITKEAHRDLCILKDVRNTFAHNLEVADFSNQSISMQCANLKLVDLYASEGRPVPDMEFAFAGVKRSEPVLASFKIGAAGTAKALAEPRGRFIWSARVFTMAFAGIYRKVPEADPWMPQI